MEVEKVGIVDRRLIVCLVVEDEMEGQIDFPKSQN